MHRFLCVALTTGLMTFGSAQAAIYELEISTDWLASDFDVSSTGTDSPSDPTVEENDDKVFGIAPSDGSLNFTLLVDTSSVTSFLVGGSHLVQHDHFGYTDVSLKSPITLGTATWDTSDILTGLLGPTGVGAALWTDTDITMADPTKLSLRLFGEWTGTGGTGTADLFFGSRTASIAGDNNAITDSFLAWEYFQGEEIRSTGYLATASPAPAVPLPAASWLLVAGLGGLAAMRKRKS